MATLEQGGVVDQPAYMHPIAYHERTKHNFGRFAKSPGYMDWQNQPNPFRSYAGCDSLPLKFLQEDPAADYRDLYHRKNNRPQPFSMDNVAALLELSLGLSAWKSAAGNRWSLRMNPSSGNLHPTECHLILPPTSSSESGLFHYNAFTHSLELRARVPAEVWRRVIQHFGTEGFLMALTSIFWRESWKYGERAFRYCNHDVGHALAAVSFAANLQGWQVKYLNAVADEQTATLLGFDRVAWVAQEEECPELLCFVCSSEIEAVPRDLSSDIVTGFSHLSVTGKPNILSGERVSWPIIETVARATQKPATDATVIDFGPRDACREVVSSLGAARIIRQRRSALAFAGEKSLARERFFALLDRTVARNRHTPFDVELSAPSVHLMIFVHNVEGLEQGLYFFVRNPADAEPIRSLARKEFLWRQVEQGLPLYLLQTGDFRRLAARISCDQEIAGYGVFSLGMIARFRRIIRENPYRYRQLFWESGMLGQILYLEAEAHGLRGTGIGCFYDDPVHEILGLSDNSYQSLYHFTVGDPIEDRRLTTHPPYMHLQDRR
ncbi:SagB/ThcOx family dehydrogenase [Desulfoferrobacter suflitae]|uniref:SagB/ThcOx family dehydrogenase n=1 Tax=Desulfoferrobacter suflitae TaxID=2865782 RepID=UPI0021648C8A|nr:SagB/ThcOx family dehydrogenase [Desulfoferrobacter suflitae]MCK8601238.1 SagB/ThcOx family dehydrogenase [Desulfoferrobacter suflitae]